MLKDIIFYYQLNVLNFCFWNSFLISKIYIYWIYRQIMIWFINTNYCQKSGNVVVFNYLHQYNAVSHCSFNIPLKIEQIYCNLVVLHIYFLTLHSKKWYIQWLNVGFLWFWVREITFFVILQTSQVRDKSKNPV